MKLSSILVSIALAILCASGQAQTTLLSLSSDELVPTAVFNEVLVFTFDIEINQEIDETDFDNPEIVSVRYTVDGTLPTSTPSGFTAFALEREMTGTEFYDQGSSLSFQVNANANLDDGVQMDELVGTGLVFTFNGREIGNGRFHPALLELNSDGTGRIQNSNNVISESPLESVDFGDEYITDINYDRGNTTLLTAVTGTTTPTTPTTTPQGFGAAGSGGTLMILLAGFVAFRRRLGH
ncbi:MAG: hypothetical protein AB8F65_06210 [Woeseiaceae bacterium]